VHIISQLLQKSNSFSCDGKKVGRRIAAMGKDALWSKRSVQAIDVVVIHYMSAVERFPDAPFSMENILSIFCEYSVSAHYLIDREGVIFQLVPDIYKAWHAGPSIMPEPDNRQGVNEFSIGIELLATDTSGFTSTQYTSLSDLCAGIERAHKKKMAYVGHDQIAGKRAVAMGLRETCKVDPGPLFDWTGFFNKLEKQRKVSDDQLLM